jgi:predicted component of type VI protein secretion system
MCRLQILSGRLAGQVILARHFPFLLGRSPQCDLVLPDPGVWDEHCRLEYRPPEGCFLCAVANIDTRVDSRKVEGEALLRNAAEITLGGARVRFSLADPMPKRLFFREAIAWVFLATVLAAEAWLIRWLS